MRNIFIRATLLYDTSRAFTLPIAAAGRVLSTVNFGGVLSTIMGAGAMKPLPADVVAEAVIEAVEEGNVRGSIEFPEIEALAQRAWRKGML
jgi:hypothetical protein